MPPNVPPAADNDGRGPPGSRWNRVPDGPVRAAEPYGYQLAFLCSSHIRMMVDGSMHHSTPAMSVCEAT